MQDTVDAFIPSIFPRLVPAVGGGYEDHPLRLFEALRMLLTTDASLHACQAFAVPFADARGRRPHALQPCGHAVCTAALDRCCAERRCLVCGAAVDNATVAPVCQHTLDRVAASAAAASAEKQSGADARRTTEDSMFETARLANTVNMKKVRQTYMSGHRASYASVTASHVHAGCGSSKGSADLAIVAVNVDKSGGLLSRPQRCLDDTICPFSAVCPVCPT
jgi:hypothetical protein